MADLTILAQVAAGGLTRGRALALAGLAVGIVGVVLGARALGRSAGADRRRKGIVALVVGLIGAGLAGLHLATASGAIGTGSGKLGAIVALLVSLVANALGWLAITRSRRSS
jgi:hypothetical protein